MFWKTKAVNNRPVIINLDKVKAFSDSVEPNIYYVWFSKDFKVDVRNSHEEIEAILDSYGLLRGD